MISLGFSPAFIGRVSLKRNPAYPSPKPDTFLNPLHRPVVIAGDGTVIEPGVAQGGVHSLVAQ